MALAQSVYRSYGDSITGGFGASGAPAFYVNLIAADSGARSSNVARAGQLACNIARMEAFSADRPVQHSDGASYVTMLEGTNDANATDGGPSELNFNRCQQASLTWLAIPYGSKATAQSTACVKSGIWNINYYEGDEMNSTVLGSTMDCSLTTSGGPLYFWYGVGDAYTSSFTYQIDGGAYVTVQGNSTVSMANRNNTEQTGVFSVRVPGLASGTHHVKFTVTSPTSDSNVVDIWGIGTPPPAGAADTAPRVFVGGVPYQTGDARSTITAAFNKDAMDNVAAAQADGLPVTFVDIRATLKGTSNEMADQLHPNDLGHSEIRDSFEAAIKGR